MSQSNLLSNIKLPPAAPSSSSSSTPTTTESSISPSLSGTSTPSPTKSKGNVGPLLGKLAAKKRLAAFSGKTSFSLGKVNQPIKNSALTELEKGKQVESKEIAVTVEKKFKKKKKEEKVSIIEQIRNEENRIKLALGGSIDKFNPYTEHLINYIDNPESLKRLEEKGKKYVAMIEKRRLDELKKEENEKKKVTRDRERDDKRKKEKERARVKEKEKLKEGESKTYLKRKDVGNKERKEFRLPKNWEDFKKLDLSMDEFSKKVKENSKNKAMLKLKMMTDVIADGQNENRKTYPGRLIRFTKQKPSLSFAPNSDTIPHLYLNRQSMKLMTSHQVYDIMKEIWNNPKAYIPDIDCEKEIDYRAWYDRIWDINESSTDIKISSKWDSDQENDDYASDNGIATSRKDIASPQPEASKIIVSQCDELPEESSLKEELKVDDKDIIEKSDKEVDGSAIELNQEYEAFLQMVGGEDAEKETMMEAHLDHKEVDDNKSETLVDFPHCEEKLDDAEGLEIKANKLSKKEKKKAKKLKKEKLKAAAKLARKERKEAKKLAKKAKKKEKREKERLAMVEESSIAADDSSKNAIENSSILFSDLENVASEEIMEASSDGYTMSDNSTPQMSLSNETSESKVSDMSFEIYSPSGSPAASPPSPYSPSYSPCNDTMNDTPDFPDHDTSVEKAPQPLQTIPVHSVNEVSDSQFTLFPSNIPLPVTSEQPKLIPSPQSIPLPPTSVGKSLKPQTLVYSDHPPPQSKVAVPQSVNNLPSIDSKSHRVEKLPFSLMEIPLPPVASDSKESFSPSIESVVSSQTSTPEPSDDQVEETPAIDQPKEQNKSIIFKLTSTKKSKKLLKPVLSNFSPEDDAKKKNFDVGKELRMNSPKTDDQQNFTESSNTGDKSLNFNEISNLGPNDMNNFTGYQESVDLNEFSNNQNVIVEQGQTKSFDMNKSDTVTESLYDDLIDTEGNNELENKNHSLVDFNKEKTSVSEKESGIGLSNKDDGEKSQNERRETISADRIKRDRDYDGKKETRSPVRKRTRSPERKRTRSPERKRTRSPDRKKDTRSPERKKDARSPDRRRGTRSPDRKRIARSPDRKKDTRSPDRKRNLRSPDRKRDLRSPDRKRDTRSQDRKRTTRSPDRKRETRSPDRKRNARSPDLRRKNERSPSGRRKRSPNQRSRSPSYRRDRRRSRSPNYRHEQYSRYRERSPSDKKQRLDRDYYQSKDHERLPAEFNPDIARELLQGQGAPQTENTSELPKNIPSITSYTANTAMFTEEHQPEWNYNSSDFYDHSDISTHSQNWNQLNYQSSNNVYLKPIAPEPESKASLNSPSSSNKLQEIAPKDTKGLGVEGKKGNNSPKRLSLDDRLVREHGLQLLEAADPPPVPLPVPNPTWKIPDFSALKSIPLPPSSPSPVTHPVSSQSNVVQVGNMLQILPQECPPISDSANLLTPKTKDSKTTATPVSKAPEAPKASQLGLSDETTTATAAVVASASAAAATDPSLIPLLAVAAAEAVALGTDSQTTLNTLLKIIESKKKGELVEKEAPPLPDVAPPPPLPPPQTSPDFEQEVNLLKEKQERARKARKERKEIRRKEREERRAARKKEEENKMREREEAKKEEERLKETVEEKMEDKSASQTHKRVDHNTLLKEAMTEEPDLGSPVAEYELEAEAAEAEAMRLREAEEAIERERRKYYPKPTPDKGILIMNFNYSYEGSAKRKRVSFGDGVLPGEGTSPSGGEETPHSPPPSIEGENKPKTKRLRKKNKPRLRTIKLFEGIPSDTTDAMCLSPPPPPSSPPPPDADPSTPSLLFLYPGYTQYKLKEPGVCVLYTHPTPHTLVCGGVNGNERLGFGAMETAYVSPAVI